MTLLQRIRYLWIRAGLVVLVASPIAMYLVFRAQDLPPDTFTTTAQIRVTETDTHIRFAPSSEASIGWMLLPGCPADPRAYGPLARAIAARGIASVIVKVPYRCAPWPQHAAELRRRVQEVIALCGDCRWTLAGHSRGARHVLEIARTVPARTIASLVLMASTHPRDDDYSSLPMPVLKIMASEDGVAPVETARAGLSRLPLATRFEVIDGGNHSQFAYYGFQLFDGSACISRQEQHARIVMQLMSWLRDNK